MTWKTPRVYPEGHALAGQPNPDHGGPCLSCPPIDAELAKKYLSIVENLTRGLTGQDLVQALDSAAKLVASMKDPCQICKGSGHVRVCSVCDGHGCLDKIQVHDGWLNGPKCTTCNGCGVESITKDQVDWVRHAEANK